MENPNPTPQKNFQCKEAADKIVVGLAAGGSIMEGQ
jgi:hypothetical protein